MNEIPDLEGLLAGSAALFAVMAGMYVYVAVCLMIIAKKTGTAGGWMAWVPLANLVLMVRIAGRSGAWVVLCLIPILNIIFLVILWVDIAKARGKAGWLGALILVPLVNFLVPAILAAGPASSGAAGLGTGPIPPVGMPMGGGAPGATPFTANTRCQACGAYLGPGEQFCGDCGARVMAPPQPQQQQYGAAPGYGYGYAQQAQYPQQQPPYHPHTHPPPHHQQHFPGQGWQPPVAPVASSAAPAKSGGGGAMTAVWVVLGIVMLGGAWWLLSSLTGGRGGLGAGSGKAGMGEIPKRMAGVMKEFPVDSSAKTPARPAGVISHDLRASRGAASKKSMPAGWLPPGVTVPAIAPYTETITTARYKSPEAPGSVYVSVMQTEQELDFTAVETAVAQGASGAAHGPVGAHVDSPSGEGYDGMHMSSGGSDVYVLHDVSPHSHIVIVVFSPASDTKEVSARLASSVGNGNGLADYPETQDSLASLPPEPDGMTLEGVMDYDASQFFSEPGIQQAMGGASIPPEVQSQVKQFIPERVTVAQYRDRARNEYVALAGDYGGRTKSWWIWGMIRGVSAMGGASAATAGGNSGLTFVDGQNRLWVHRSGPKIILLTASSGAPAANLNALAAGAW